MDDNKIQQSTPTLFWFKIQMVLKTFAAFLLFRTQILPSKFKFKKILIVRLSADLFLFLINQIYNLNSGYSLNSSIKFILKLK